MESFKELSSLRMGEYGVAIEFCFNCSSHNGSLRHDEQKYLNKALELKNSIYSEFPFIKIFLKPLQMNNKNYVQKLGLLEVNLFMYDRDHPILISSKLKTMQWPDTRLVINNIRQHFEGRCFQIRLNLPEDANFNPLNSPSSLLTTSLVSFYDIGLFEEKIKKKIESLPRRAITSTLNKPRQISAAIKMKIQSGVFKETEINDLINCKEYCYEQKPSKSLYLQYNNIKPGRYKLIVLESQNYETQDYDIYVQPPFRKNDPALELQFNLKPKINATFVLDIELDVGNPIYKASYLHIDNDSKSQDSVSQSEEEMHCLGVTKNGDKGIYNHFELNNFKSGNYLFNVEFKDYSNWRMEIFLFPGLNKYKLLTKDMRLVENFANSDEIQDNAREERNFYKPQNDKIGLKNVMTPISELPIAENQSVNNNSYITKDANNIENQSSLTKDENEDKENKKAKENQKEEEEGGFPKQRITSGNRMRPGERLYSAKSKSNQITSDTQSKSKLFLLKNLLVSPKDKSLSVFENYCNKDFLNIFMKQNNYIKIEFKIRLLKEMEENECSDIYQEAIIEDSYEHYSLKHHKNIKFVRIFAQRSVGHMDNNIELILVNNDKTYRYPISELFNEGCFPDETFIEMAFMIQNESSNEFEFIPMIVPMKKPVRIKALINELKSTVVFLKNSKYDYKELFGFDEMETDEDSENSIPFEDARTNLKTYEINLSQNYILNSLRIGKTKMVSLSKLEENYANWQQIVNLLKDVEEEDDDQSESGSTSLKENDQYEDEDFDVDNQTDVYEDVYEDNEGLESEIEA